jgi:hypothetical protein
VKTCGKLFLKKDWLYQRWFNPRKKNRGYTSGDDTRGKKSGGCTPVKKSRDRTILIELL